MKNNSRRFQNSRKRQKSLLDKKFNNNNDNSNNLYLDKIPPTNNIEKDNS